MKVDGWFRWQEIDIVDIKGDLLDTRVTLMQVSK